MKGEGRYFNTNFCASPIDILEGSPWTLFNGSTNIIRILTFETFRALANYWDSTSPSMSFPTIVIADNS